MTQVDSGDLAVVIDVIRMSLTSNKRVTDAWIRAMEAVKCAKDHRPVDLFVCMLLAELPKRQKAVETLFRNKVRQGHFNEDFFKKAVGTHKTSLRAFFKPLMAMTETFMHSAEPYMQKFAGKE